MYSPAREAARWIPAFAGMTMSPSAAWSFFLDVPQEHHRGNDDPAHVLAVRRWNLEQPGRNVVVLVGVVLDLDAACQLLLRREFSPLKPLINHLFELSTIAHT